MSKAEVKVLQKDVKDLNEQLYASYDRIIELLRENAILRQENTSQQDVINALAESISEGNRRDHQKL